MSQGTKAGNGDVGGFTRLHYDRCAYQKDLWQSVEPLGYWMYPGKHENCSKCTHDENYFPRPFDVPIVDAESELKNITRRSTKCPQYKYLPGCEKSCYCTNTFDSSNKIVMPQEVCPIVHNNIPRIRGPGYTLETEPFCKKRIPRNPVSVNTIRGNIMVPVRMVKKE
jgi:hypothetical protein